ncbi:MAG TPA: PilN domain-containing protein, partial [Thermodesulfobacteriota bacterium]|nr:PilN domain-containing protein [Thermodesulfobacteriota bacterium]
GIQPIGVELSTTALVNGLFSGKNGSIPRDAVAFLSVDSRCFETAWIHNSTLRYSHVIAFDGKPDENRAVKVEKEIRNSFRIAFPAQPGNTAEENASEPVVYLLGTDLPDTLIADTVQNSDCTVQVLPMEAFTSQVKSTPPVPHSLAVALGLALRGMKKMPCELNLLPHPLRKKTRKMGVYLSIILFLVMIVLTITWGVSSVAKKRLVLHTIEQEIAALKDDVEAIQKIQEQARFFQDKIKSVERVQSFEDSNLKILKELSMIVPPSVWLTNLRYYRNEVQLSGYAQSSSELIAILDGSPLFCSSEFTAPITRDPQGQESFKITTRIEKKTESGSQ